MAKSASDRQNTSQSSKMAMYRGWLPAALPSPLFKPVGITKTCLKRGEGSTSCSHALYHFTAHFISCSNFLTGWQMGG